MRIVTIRLLLLLIALGRLNAQEVVQVPAGSNFTISASVTSDAAVLFQWRKNGVVFNTSAGDNLILRGVTSADAGEYSLIATNFAGSTLSNSVVIAVTGDGGTLAVPPVITSQPGNVDALVGSSIAFQVTATGVPTPTYQWLRNGAPISGATSATLSLIDVQANANYSAVVTNSAGSVESRAASLVVFKESTPVGDTATVPVFTQHPSDYTVPMASSVTFVAAATGTPAPTYQWKKNGTDVYGGTNATLVLGSVSAQDASRYWVAATNSFGTTNSQQAVLTVTAAGETPTGETASAPVFTQQPSDYTVPMASSVTFMAAATGTPTPTYQWKKNGTDVYGGTNATLVLGSVSGQDASRYWVVATNSAGTTKSQEAVLTVTAAAQTPTGETASAPVFTQQPSDYTVPMASSVTFMAAATGTPAPTYQWKKNGTDVYGGTNATLVLGSVSGQDASRYWVVATNSAGTTKSQEVVLTVTAAGETPTGETASAPVFTQQPSDYTVPMASSVTFMAAATGTPAPTYQWKKNGTDVYGGTNATLVLGSVSGQDASRYWVVATNSAGTTKSQEAVLTVTAAGETASAPVFTQQPSDYTVPMASSVTFMAAATGTPAPTYQWKKNGTDVYGGTNATLVLGSVSGQDASRYWVVATNSAGTTKSQEVVLTVTAPAAITTQPVVQAFTFNINPGEKQTVGFTVRGDVPKAVLIRAVGPTLGMLGISKPLADPQFELNNGLSVVNRNDNWGGGADLMTAFAQAGAIPLMSTDSKDAALFMTLAPGVYNVVTSSVDGEGGTVLLEVYEFP